jgi:hypothetical protein
MPNLDDHMDELFQKAAENYPLNTRPGNFDDLVRFVAGEIASTPAAVVVKGKRKTALLLLVLVLIATSVSTYFITNNNGKPLSHSVPTIKQNNNVEQLNNEVTSVNSSTSVSESVLAENILPENKRLSFTKGRFTGKTSQAGASADVIHSAIIHADGTGKTTNKANRTSTNQQQINETATAETTAIITIEEKKKATGEEKKATVKPSDQNKIRPSFYYGIAAGTELNQVKNQGMTKAGFNFGIVFGLQITKKMTVETGVLLSQKKYYTTGEHFNPKNGSMPSNMTIRSLNGTSTLIEIPISIKYNLSKKENSFYGKAGISSYLMTKETNAYQAIVSGQQQEINSTYNNSKTYTAAGVLISAGYQHSLGKKSTIRVEPYIQIPLKGIGIGAVRVTTTGIQLVLTRN